MVPIFIHIFIWQSCTHYIISATSTAFVNIECVIESLVLFLSPSKLEYNVLFVEKETMLLLNLNPIGSGGLIRPLCPKKVTQNILHSHGDI